MNMKIKKIRSLKPEKHHIVCLGLAIVIFIINFQIVGKCSHPFIFNDEAGYWTHAAVMAGKDWSGVSNGLGWYSYGYSLFLTVLIRIFSDTTVLYRAALVLNIAMLIAVYFLYIKIIEDIFPKVNKYAVYFAAFAAALYTPYQVQSGIAWSETAILFVTVLLTYNILRFIKKPTYINSASLGLLSIYIYMVHNRCIGIVLSVILVVGLSVLFRNTKVRHAVLFLSVLAAGLLANKLICGYLEDIIWISGRPSGNDMGSTMPKIKAAFTTAEGFKSFVSLMLSQSFAAFVSAMCLAIIALWSSLKNIFSNLLKVIKAVKNRESIRNILDTRSFMLLFVFCSFASTLIISSIFMFTYARVDHILYTRYFDMTVGILVAIGICSVFTEISDNKSRIVLALVPVILYIGANRAEALLNNLSSPVFNMICSPGIATMYYDYNVQFTQYAFISVTVFGIAMACVFLMKKHNNIGICIAAVICSVFFLFNSEAGKKQILNSQKAGYDDVALLERIEELPERDIYILNSCGTFMQFAQYRLMDIRLNVIDQIEEAGENSYVLANSSDIINLSDYQMIDYSDNHVLVLSSDVSESNSLKALPLSFMHTFDTEAYDEEYGTINSLSDNNYLCFGPYMNADPGDYLFNISLTANSLPDGDEKNMIGYAECRSSAYETVYARLDISADMFDEDNSLIAELAPEFALPLNDMEIIVFIYDPESVSLQLDSIEYMEVN